MNYAQTLDYLYSQLPMYQRVGQAAYKADLKNTVELCNLLGNPQTKFNAVHVAGTNGKGSTAHLIASILHESGMKVGLYTSPHLKDFRERIRINGAMIPEQAVIDFVTAFRSGFELIEPSFFEWTVGLAFHHFAEQQIDIAILETGMGGRLDSTNVVTPLVSVITNISYDHMQFLGDSLEKIAVEKAGIIKKGVPVVIGETQPETEPVFRKAAMAFGSQIYFADQMILADMPGTDLGGRYQAKNIKTALQTIEVLKGQDFMIPESHIVNGIKNAAKNTGLAGRWQQISAQPLTICDIAHNHAGLEMIFEQVKETPHRELHLVMGMVNDKSIDDLLQLLPKSANYYFCAAGIPRALPAEILRNTAVSKGLTGNHYPSVRDALTQAQRTANTDDLILVCGSAFVVAEVI